MNATIYVSLGSNCIPAFHLRDAGFRAEAYPFDWTLTPHVNGLMRAIETKFKDFFLKENLIHVEAHHIRDTLYQMTYLHDFPFHLIDIPNGKYPQINADWINSYPEIKEKYDRRIERFHNLANISEPIYFFRFFSISKSEAIQIKDLLDNQLHLKGSTLVVLNNTDEFKEDWKLADIKNFYFEGKLEEAWNPKLFKNMCQKLGIIIPNTRERDNEENIRHFDIN
jgi:hypothetical protein